MPSRLITLSALLLLTSCYEPASTWSEKQGRYRPTDEVRREIINEEIERNELRRPCEQRSLCEGCEFRVYCPKP